MIFQIISKSPFAVRKAVFQGLPRRFHKYLPTPAVVNTQFLEGSPVKFISQGDRVGQFLHWSGFKGHNEEGTIAIYQELVKSSKLFFIVGGHTGIFSVVGSILNPQAQLHVFEPVPRIYDRLCENIKVNNLKNVVCVNCAASNSSDPLTINVPRVQFPSDSSVRSGFRNSTEAVVVSSTTLDSYQKENQLGPIDFMLIDTETTENFVLQGAQHILKVDQPIIICEVLKGFIEAQLQEILSSSNYSFYWINGSKLEKQEQIVADPTYKEKNFLFVPISKEQLLIPKLQACIC